MTNPNRPIEDEPGACCRKLLSEGLDLCVRARRLDSQQRTNDMVASMTDIDMERAAPRLNACRPDAPYLTQSHTIAVWAAEQYETDLADWERRSRQHLTQGCKA